MADDNRFGTKHSCVKCGAKFYDMNRPDLVCPRCGSAQDGGLSTMDNGVPMDGDFSDVMGRVFDDDQSLPGDLDLEVAGLDGDDPGLPVMADDIGVGFTAEE